MKAVTLAMIAVCGFAAGAATYDQFAQPRLETCKQHRERAVQYASVIAGCLNGGTIFTEDVRVRCSPKEIGS